MPGELHFSQVSTTSNPKIYRLEPSKDAGDVTYQRNRNIELAKDVTTKIMELANDGRGVAFDSGKIKMPGWVAVATQVGINVFIEMTDHGFNWMLICEDCKGKGCSKCKRKGYLSEEEVASLVNVATGIGEIAIGKAAEAMGLGIAGPLLAPTSLLLYKHTEGREPLLLGLWLVLTPVLWRCLYVLSQLHQHG